MPYAPGITDISGQLRAQGMIAGGNARAQGIAQFGESLAGGIQTYQQNRMMASQATAKADAIFQQNPDILQFLTSEDAPSDLAKLYSKRQKDGTLPLKDAATLAQYAETAVGQKKQAQAAALQQMQMQQFAMVAAQRKKQMEDDIKAQQGLRAAMAPDVSTVSDLEGFVDQAANKQPRQRNADEILGRFMRSGAPLTEGVRRALNDMRTAEERSAATQARIGDAEKRANVAEAKLENQLGPYDTPEQALQAGVSAIKRAGTGFSGFHPEVVPSPGGTFTVKITKPYAQGSDSAERAANNRAQAQDELEMAVNAGDQNAIAKAQAKFDFWNARASRVSQPPNQPRILDPMNYEIAKMSVAKAGGDPDKMFGTDYGQYLVAHGGKPTTQETNEPKTPEELVAWVKADPKRLNAAKEIAKRRGWK